MEPEYLLSNKLPGDADAIGMRAMACESGTGSCSQRAALEVWPFPHS